jgi:tetratricopeptide (TPR) repeat protein
VSEYSIHEVQRTLGLSRGMILGLVKSGYVTPELGPRRAYRFTFRDLVVMRTAQELIAAKIPARRVAQTLKRLRAQLPGELPLGGLRIRAAGDRIVVQEGARQWEAGTGQYVLDLSVSGAGGSVRMLVPPAVPPTAPASKEASAADWFDQGCEAEEQDARRAAAAYQRAIETDPSFAGAYLNLGRLLHELGRLTEAEAVYRNGVSHCPEDALLRYNLGVLLEDLGRQKAALESYREALALQDDLADCHYNIALLYESSGMKSAALRHLNAYRRLQAGRA